MDTLVHGLRSAVEYALLPFDALAPFWSLTLLSLLTGAIMLWVLGRLTPQRRIEIARARMASAIYELRLFLDSPRRIFASQGRLLLWSQIYILYMLPAFMLLGLPMWLMYLHLEPRHGLEPLPLNTPIVVKIALEPGSQAADREVIIEAASPGIQLTAPPLRVPDENLVYARVTITEPAVQELTIRAGSTEVRKRLSADPDRVQISPERVSGSMALLWSFGHEPPLPDGSGIAAITVEHPEAPQAWLGMDMPWWLYALLLATIAALALRGPMGVTL